MGRFASKARQWLRKPLAARASRRDHRFDDQSAVELAAAAIFRDEAPHLDEWIAFHIGVGFRHFYLYNNFSQDNYQSVLRPWIETGYVTLYQWPVKVGQLSAYQHCCRIHRDDCRWLALFDIDEFLFSPLSPSSRDADIRPILREFEHLSGLEVWQAFYGSGGRQQRPDLPVTLAYDRRAAFTQTTVKSIVNPRLVYKPGIHQSKFFVGHVTDTSGQTVVRESQPVFDRLRMNHYWSRSLEDLSIKVNRGDASTSTERDRDWHFRFEKTLNDVRDPSIIPLAQQILQNRNAA